MESNPKRVLRKEIRSRLSTCKQTDFEAQSQSVFARIEAMDEFAAAHTVAIYWSLDDELPTHDVTARWALTKRILLPVVTGSQMEFREYSAAEMVQGAYGIMEPGPGVVVGAENIDFMVVPAMAYDESGARMGRGRGYYDRYLAQSAAANIFKVGVCMSCQLCVNIPCEPHDVKVDRVIC